MSATKRELQFQNCIADSHFLFDRRDSDVNEVSYEEIELFIYL